MLAAHFVHIQRLHLKCLLLVDQKRMWYKWTYPGFVKQKKKQTTCGQELQDWFLSLQLSIYINPSISQTTPTTFQKMLEKIGSVAVWLLRIFAFIQNRLYKDHCHNVLLITHFLNTSRAWDIKYLPTDFLLLFLNTQMHVHF